MQDTDKLNALGFIALPILGMVGMLLVGGLSILTEYIEFNILNSINETRGLPLIEFRDTPHKDYHLGFWFFTLLVSFILKFRD
jgi:hypothetical protein